MKTFFEKVMIVPLPWARRLVAVARRDPSEASIPKRRMAFRDGRYWIGANCWTVLIGGKTEIEKEFNSEGKGKRKCPVNGDGRIETTHASHSNDLRRGIEEAQDSSRRLCREFASLRELVRWGNAVSDREKCWQASPHYSKCISRTL